MGGSCSLHKAPPEVRGEREGPACPALHARLGRPAVRLASRGVAWPSTSLCPLPTRGHPPAAGAQPEGRAAPLGMERVQQLPRGQQQGPQQAGAALPHLLPRLRGGCGQRAPRPEAAQGKSSAPAARSGTLMDPPPLGSLTQHRGAGPAGLWGLLVWALSGESIFPASQEPTASLRQEPAILPLLRGHWLPLLVCSGRWH